ncbi:hypothetical protein AB6A40_000412 [Gnathostoma spinigerum]|uniref:G domain-containing protein n=1 Tax=Gnathostoma spinigerum TaxID=75299 RepID=A0ABD6E239_9BILA
MFKRVLALTRFPNDSIPYRTSKHFLSRREAKRIRTCQFNSPSRSELSARLRQRFEDNEREVAIKMAKDTKENGIEFDSLAARMYFESHKDKFTAIAKHSSSITKRETLEKTEELGDCVKTDYPLAGVPLPPASSDLSGDAPSCKYSNVEDSKERISVDRGFYVYGDQYKDEYIAGSVTDLPVDEMMSNTYLRFGPESAVEEIDFQQPGQSTTSGGYSLECFETSDDEKAWLQNYGKADPSICASKQSCSGCGARFHCKDSSLPGFLPVELFIQLDSRIARGQSLCRRCYLLKKYNLLLNVNVCDVDYKAMMGHLKLKQEVLILLIVDMTDLPFSIHKDLPNIIGDRKPMIVIGNKVDLIPPGQQPGYLKGYRDALFAAVREAGFADRFNLLHTTLVSAKTGFGIEELITTVHMKWSAAGSLRDDLYLVGCTNAGKSTLFNTLLQSDMCKVRAVDLVERATTSVWPGTTISLLKFPIMNPTPEKLEIRRRRLLVSQAWNTRELRLRKSLLAETKDPKYATLQSYVGNSYKTKEEEIQPISVLELRKMDQDPNQQMMEKKQRKKIIDENHFAFSKGHWCYDTPGTVNTDQVLNLFTLDELVNLVPRKMILPRTFIVYPDQSLLIGGVARIDIESTGTVSAAVYLTVFASDRLPVNVLKTSDVDGFLRKYMGSLVLVVPQGDPQRIAEFPQLKSTTFTVNGKGTEQSVADIVLSSIGWVSVASRNSVVNLRAYTPDGRGIISRFPPLLPSAVNTRGSRIPGTAAYKVKPIEFPINHVRRSNGRRRSVGYI